MVRAVIGRLGATWTAVLCGAVLCGAVLCCVVRCCAHFRPHSSYEVVAMQCSRMDNTPPCWPWTDQSRRRTRWSFSSTTGFSAQDADNRTAEDPLRLQPRSLCIMPAVAIDHSQSVSRCAVLRRAVPCRAVLCCALLYRAVMCRAVPCRAVPCRAVPC